MCLADERWSKDPAYQEHDLEEIRLLFARYRRAVTLAQAMDTERMGEADAARDPERVPAGVSA